MVHPAVSIGLLLPTREVVMAQGPPDLSKIIDLAVRADQFGQLERCVRDVLPQVRAA